MNDKKSRIKYKIETGYFQNKLYYLQITRYINIVYIISCNIYK